jgi:Protein of unknown function (DUF2778)
MYSTVPFSDAIPLEAPAFPPGAPRRVLVGAAMVGLGVAASAGLAAAAAAAWVIAASLTASPTLYDTAPVAPKLLTPAGRIARDFPAEAPALALRGPFGRGPFGSLAGAFDLSGPPPAQAVRPAPLRLRLAESGPAPIPPQRPVILRAGPSPFAEPAEEMAAPPAELPPVVAQAAPLPPRNPYSRPHVEGRYQVARLAPTSVAPAAPAAPQAPTEPTPHANSNPIARFFAALTQSSNQTVAEAQPEDGAVYGAPVTVAGLDGHTAIYDIAAHLVYLPNGERLEAHSGLGNLLDDPRYVNAKDRGPTPPHLYNLELRRQLFHGVQALRLDPVGSGAMYGRVGLLAHTYMLGANGQSNGCVSFRDYSRFLQAYMSGEVQRLFVVPHLGSGQSWRATASRRGRVQYASNNS